MKFNFKKVLKIDGKPVTEKVRDENNNIVDREVTFGAKCKSCILAMPSLDPAKIPGMPEAYKGVFTGEDKYKRYRLAQKIDDGSDLTAEDVALIKKDIGVLETSTVVGIVWDFLESYLVETDKNLSEKLS